MSKFNDTFIKNYDRDSDEWCMLELDVQYPKKLHKLHNDIPFLPERRRLKNVISLYAICMIKTNILHT